MTTYLVNLLNTLFPRLLPLFCFSHPRSLLVLLPLHDPVSVPRLIFRPTTERVIIKYALTIHEAQLSDAGIYKCSNLLQVIWDCD